MPWGLLILLAVGLALGWLLALAYTIYLLTHPPRRTYAWAVARNLPGDPSEVIHSDPPLRGLRFTEWAFCSRGRDLPVWDIDGLNPRGPIVIITHGWADSRIVMLSRVAAFAAKASRVIAWDLPGQGSAGGVCTLGTREVDDLLTLIEELVGPNLARQTVETGRHTDLVLYGFSLGAGVSIAAAVQRPERVLAVIAEAPYRVPPTPARNVLRLRALPYVTTLPAAMAVLGSWLGQGLEWLGPSIRRTRDGAPGFDRAQLAAQLPSTVPLLVIHGEIDPVCPIEDGREIAAAVPSGRFVPIAGGGHNNLWTTDALALQTTTCVSDFLDELESSRVPADGAPAP